MQKVLVRPSVAQLARSDGMACFQRGMAVDERCFLLKGFVMKLSHALFFSYSLSYTRFPNRVFSRAHRFSLD